MVKFSFTKDTNIQIPFTKKTHKILEKRIIIRYNFQFYRQLRYRENNKNKNFDKIELNRNCRNFRRCSKTEVILDF